MLVLGKDGKRNLAQRRAVTSSHLRISKTFLVHERALGCFTERMIVIGVIVEEVEVMRSIDREVGGIGMHGSLLITV